MSEIVLHRFSSKNDLSWALLPQLNRRFVDFCIEFNQGDPEGHLLKVQSAIITHQDHIAVWCAVRVPEYQVVSHMVCAEDLYNGHPTGFVTQWSCDPGVRIPRSVLRTCREEMEAWGKARGYSKLVMITHNTRFKAWLKLTGFEPYRVVMRNPLGHGPDDGG
jgi:hypothetical protein